jgi:hypothetical protein
MASWSHRLLQQQKDQLPRYKREQVKEQTSTLTREAIFFVVVVVV